MKIKTNVKGGTLSNNHNVNAAAQPVRARVQAGALALNHSESIVATRRGSFGQIYGCFLVAAVVLQLLPTLRGAIPGAPVARPANISVHADSGNGHQEKLQILPPVSAPFGHTYSEWDAKWWQWNLALPVDQNPATTGGTANCANGQSGHVWFLVGVGGPTTIHCTVPRGIALFVPVVNTECSNLEPDPYHGSTPDKRHECAEGWIEHVSALSAVLDGEPVDNLRAYRSPSPDYNFKVPDNNILGVPGSTQGKSSADGYYLMLAPPSAGVHTIQIQGTFHDPAPPHAVVFVVDTEIVLTVGR